MLNYYFNMTKNIDAFYKEANLGKLPPLTLMIGEEVYPIDMTIDAVSKKVDFEQLNIVRLTSFSVEELKNAISTPPIMSNFRLILLYESEILSILKSANNMVEQIFGDIPDFVRVIIYERSIKKNLKIYKDLSKIALIVESPKRNQKKLESWIISSFKNKKIKVSRQAVFLLSDIGAKKNMYDIANAIDYFASVGSDIGKAEVNDYFKLELDTNFFDLYDLFGTDKMYAHIRKIVDSGEPPLKIFHTIGNLLRYVYKIKLLISEGNSAKKIEENLGATRFMLNKAMRIQSMYSLEKLEKLIILLQELDMEFKSGPQDDKALLDKLLIEHLIRK